MLRKRKIFWEVARYSRYDHFTILRWSKKLDMKNADPIPTLSSCPRSNPNALPREKIVLRRLEQNRCGQVVYQALLGNAKVSMRKRDLALTSLTVYCTILSHVVLIYPDPFLRVYTVLLLHPILPPQWKGVRHGHTETNAYCE